MGQLSRPRLERLMRYYQFLCDLSEPPNDTEPARTVTSVDLGNAMEQDQTLVRKDLAAIGIVGRPGQGFSVVEICGAIRHSLGFNRVFPAVLVGAGHLGGALMAYPGFRGYGLRIVAAFDKDATKVGSVVAGSTVKPLSALRAFVRRRGVRLAIMTTPAESAQALANQLTEAGIKAIWNFTSAKLSMPDETFVRNEQIALGLGELVCRLNQDAPNRSFSFVTARAD